MLHQRQLAAPGKALNFVEFIRQIHAVHVSHIYSRGVASMLCRPSSVIVCKGVPGAPTMLGFRFSIFINTRASCSARRPGFPINKSIGLNRHAPIGINRSLARAPVAAQTVRSDDLGRPRAKQPFDIRRVERLDQHDDATHTALGRQACNGLPHVFGIEQRCRDDGGTAARGKRPRHGYQPVQIPHAKHLCAHIATLDFLL